MNFTNFPTTDPSVLFELYRSNYATEVLVASVVHFRLFERVAASGPTPVELFEALGLRPRAGQVLLTALRALGLLAVSPAGRLEVPELVRQHLLPESPFYIGAYFSLAADSPGVRSLVDRLTTNRPVGETSLGRGAAFIYREGMDSAMENRGSARSLTLALTGRARNVAPHLASLVRMPPGQRLLDIGAGSGVYLAAILQANPGLLGIALDRPEVLTLVEEFARAGGVADRLTCVPGDMFQSPLPASNAILLSNVLHDWDVDDCRFLVRKCAESLAPGGRLMVHDAFLADDLSGPLPVALYSLALFTLTEGRAYSGAEMREWMNDAGLKCGSVEPTLIHCGLLTGTKPDL